MKIKFTLRRSGAGDCDLVATVDASTTVGELAAHIAQSAPDGGRRVRSHTAPVDDATLAIVDVQTMTLDPRLPVADSGLHSGATVSVVPGGERWVDPQVGQAALVTVTAGPDLGKEFRLARGASVIGRELSCEVCLTDPMVSRRHARLNVADSVEIIDLGSANGVSLGGGVVGRSALRSGDTVVVGDTELSVRVVNQAAPSGTTDSGIGFVRSPRVEPVYEPPTLVAPEPPQRPALQRFPLIALVSPVIMGGLLYLITRSLTSLTFVALSPLLLVGSALESRLAGRSSYKKALAVFDADLDSLVVALKAAAGDEVAARRGEHPAVTECVDAVRQSSTLTWSRRPDGARFLEVRFGLGRLPSRTVVDLPDAKRAPRDLYARLTGAIDPFTGVDGVPVVARPATDGATGIAGSRPTMLLAARAVVAQLVVEHSPAELVVTGFGSTQTARDWDWVKWLPHASSPHSPIAGRPLVTTGPDAAALVSELEDLLDRRTSGESETVPAVVVLVEDDAPVDRSRLVALAEAGWAQGIHLIWFAGEAARLPAACRTFLEIDRAASAGAVGYARTGRTVHSVAIEGLDERAAMDLARRMAPMVDVGAHVDDDSDLPRAVSLLTIADSSPTPQAVLERWTANRSILTGPRAPAQPNRGVASLRAVIGQTAVGSLALDLRADGPHALVGGTTGSGKSELLQAWILAMACAHSPQRLSFLLVDYKGGSAFRDCVDLPHTVGLVTDLSPHLVRRALTSLSAELNYREHVLAAHGVKDLMDLEKGGVLDAPPSLVIVVDEFAALVTEVPEFVDGVVNVAQRGRSLGLHLILATQRPAGVIKDNLRANTNLRVALRMADESDSTDVLGSNQAAYFDPSLPGRGVVKTGPGRLVPFQTGYAGGWTTNEPAAPDILLEELSFGPGRQWELPTDDSPPVDPGPTDIARMVTAIGQASGMAEIAPPRKPWLPELQSVYDMADMASVPTRRRDDDLVFGVRDDPRNQAQPTVSFRPDRDGNLAVYGTGGTGKSTLLRTLALAAGFTIRGGPCHVYGVDFGARGLAMLEDLPHVGSIISGSDHERIARLFEWLRSVIDERANRYSKVNAGTISEYRTAAQAPSEARILLLLDGVAAFRQNYEVGERARWFEMLVSIANDGRQVGVHLVISADRPGAVPSVLASAVQRRLVLRMADATDYGLMGLPIDVLGPSSPPGRGLIGSEEVQVAILGREPEVAAQARMVRQFALSMQRAGFQDAPPIRRLDERVDLEELPVHVDGRPVVGMSADTLAPVGFEASGTFLISGAPGSGRTTAVEAVVRSVVRWRPDARCYYFGNRRSRLRDLGVWVGAASGPVEVAELAAKLTSDIPSIVADGGLPVIVVENPTEFVSGPADAPLQDLTKAALAEGAFIVFEGETASMGQSFGLLGVAKSGRAGLALQPDSGDGTTVYRTNFPPRLSRSDFPPGRGLLVGGGKTEIVQTGLPG